MLRGLPAIAMAWSRTSRSKGSPVDARRMLGRDSPAALEIVFSPVARSAVFRFFVTAGPAAHGPHLVLLSTDPVDGKVRHQHGEADEKGGRHIAAPAARAS